MKRITVFILSFVLVLFCSSCGTEMTSDQEIDSSTFVSDGQVQDTPASLMSFIGQSVEKITSQFGDDYVVENWRGASCMVYSEAQYVFYYGDIKPDWDVDEAPAATDQIFIVETAKNGAPILGNIAVGSTISDLEAYLNTSLTVNFDIMLEEYNTSFTEDGFQYVVSLDTTGKIITYCITQPEAIAYGISRISGNCDMLDTDLQTVLLKNKGIIDGPNGLHGQGTNWKYNAIAFYHLKNTDNMDIFTNYPGTNQYIGAEGEDIVFFGTTVNEPVGNFLTKQSLNIPPAIFTTPNGQNPSVYDTLYVWQIDNCYMIVKVVHPSGEIATQYASSISWVSDLKYLSFLVP